MTLCPVFRSADAVQMLRSKGYFDLLAPSINAEREYKRMLIALLDDVIDSRYIKQAEESDDITFLQEHFFLVLFDAVYRALDCPPDRLTTYGLLNLCIKGMVVAGDNLFDDEAKMDLPLELGAGPRFASIVQMLSFDHLVMRVFEEHGSTFKGGGIVRFRRDLLSSLASIGTLEGSEEAGVGSIPPVDEMIQKVHRVRGGQLFSLAFIAPRIGEGDQQLDRWRTAAEGIACLGTAFQIVDDLTDFEFDLTRRSHNILSAQIVHAGTTQERAAFEQLHDEGTRHLVSVENTFAESARSILHKARTEAEEGFRTLARCGFWFPPEDAELFIRAIAGDAGEARMQAVAGAENGDKSDY